MCVLLTWEKFAILARNYVLALVRVGASANYTLIHLFLLVELADISDCSARRFKLQTHREWFLGDKLTDFLQYVPAGRPE